MKRSARKRVVRITGIVGDLAIDHNTQPPRNVHDLIHITKLDLGEPQPVTIEEFVDLPGDVTLGHEIPALLNASTARERPDRQEKSLRRLFFNLDPFDSLTRFDRSEILHARILARPPNSLVDPSSRQVPLVDLQGASPVHALWECAKQILAFDFAVVVGHPTHYSGREPVSTDYHPLGIGLADVTRAMPAPADQRTAAPSPDSLEALRLRFDAIERKSGARALGIAVYDTHTGKSFRRNAERWFHAASTIKVAILVGVYASIHHGWLLPQSRLHVRNRFFGAVDGMPFRVLADRDANSEVHAAIGKMMRVSELALHMISTSSNLATNLLLDLVGLETVQRSLDELRIDGIDIRRGVEDERAFELGINNRVTADGLAQLLRLIAEERAFTPELSRDMLDILHAQEFRNGIPARLPRAVRVAHKTGEISTACHDAGIVYLPEREPYILVVLTEVAAETNGRRETVAKISEAAFQILTGAEAKK